MRMISLQYCSRRNLPEGLRLSLRVRTSALRDIRVTGDLFPADYYRV